MEKARIVQQTELTIAFTRDGKILIPTDFEGKNTIFPKYCIGIRDGYKKDLTKGEVGTFLIQYHSLDECDYKMHTAFYYYHKLLM